MKRITLISLAILALITTIVIVAIPRNNCTCITVFGDFSGGERSFAQLALNGINLAVDEVNEHNENHQLVVEVLDVSLYDNDNDVLDKLEDFQTDIIIGPFLSGTLVEYAELLQSTDYTVFVPTATSDIITDQDDNIFRLMNATSVQGYQTAELFEGLGYDKVYLIYDSINQSYTKDIMDYFEASPASNGMDITRFLLEDFAHDFTDDIDASYDAIFLCGSSEKSANAINNIRALGIDTKIFICSYSDTDLFLSTIQYNIEDVYLFSNRNIVLTTNYNQFVNRYTIEYTTTPSIASVYSYDLIFLINSILLHDDYDVDSIDEYLDQLDTYHGLFFDYHNDDHGDFSTHMGLYRVSTNSFQRITTLDLEE